MLKLLNRKNNKLMSSRIDDDKLLQKNTNICTNTEDFKKH